jgi:hypothetical protein
MKPWTARKQVAAALRNEHVGTRQGVAGRGLFAARAFAPGDAIASYQGKVIARAELAALHGSDRTLFEYINEYAVATPSGGHLYAEDVTAVGAHLINHSCGPNASWAEWEQGALLVRATRWILAGTEITIHYGWVGVKAAMEKSWHTCLCGATGCTGTIELRLEWREDDANPLQGGPFLPPEEVERRLYADIVNGVDDHERLLLRYAKNSLECVVGATSVQGVDMDAYYAKLSAAAEAAIRRVLLQGVKHSAPRLRKIANTYAVLEMANIRQRALGVSQ